MRNNKKSFSAFSRTFQTTRSPSPYFYSRLLPALDGVLAGALPPVLFLAERLLGGILGGIVWVWWDLLRLDEVLASLAIDWKVDGDLEGRESDEEAKSITRQGGNRVRHQILLCWIGKRSVCWCEVRIAEPELYLVSALDRFTGHFSGSILFGKRGYVEQM
jgi:hypothetical protein